MVRIRLARRGKKHFALYDVVVADSRSPRDGKFIEKLGTYNPNTDPAELKVNEDKAVHWMMVGAQPSETVRNLFSREGLMLKKHLQVGVHKKAITQEVANQRYEAWKQEKQAKLIKLIESKNKAKAEAASKVKSQEQLKAKAREEGKNKKAAATEGENA
ncbi:MAG: 30S ribosomal protein S16 [Flammeovirgaceae bacterium]